MADIQTLVNQVLARAEQEEQAKLQAFELCVMKNYRPNKPY